MTGWTPHRTAQQRRSERTPTQRKLDKAPLAPSVTVAPVVCADCDHPRLIHRDLFEPCLRVGCECTSYREVP